MLTELLQQYDCSKHDWFLSKSYRFLALLDNHGWLFEGGQLVTRYVLHSFGEWTMWFSVPAEQSSEQVNEQQSAKGECGLGGMTKFIKKKAELVQLKPESTPSVTLTVGFPRGDLSEVISVKHSWNKFLWYMYYFNLPEVWMLVLLPVWATLSDLNLYFEHRFLLNGSYYLLAFPQLSTLS